MTNSIFFINNSIICCTEVTLLQVPEKQVIYYNCRSIHYYLRVAKVLISLPLTLDTVVGENSLLQDTRRIQYRVTTLFLPQVTTYGSAREGERTDGQAA